MDDDEGNDLEDLFEEYENIPVNSEETPDDNEVRNHPETENQAKEKVPVPRRVVKNPRLKFNAERLCGERGIPVLVNHFKDVKFKGKGHEVEDLNKLLSTLEHWCHRLYPSMKFEDCLKQIEKLGKKRPVQTCLRKIRLDMPILHNDFIHNEDNVKREGDDNELDDLEIPPQDAFDRLINETPSTSYAQLASTPLPVKTAVSEQRLGTFGSTLTEEQKKRMEYNKLLATERRKAKLAAMQSPATDPNQSEDLFCKIQDSTLGHFDQTTRLISEDNASGSSSLFGSRAAETLALSKSKSTLGQPAFASIQEASSEELELDELVDLVDDEDDIERIPNGYTMMTSQNKPQVEYVDLTDRVNLKSGNKNLIQMIDLENESNKISNNNAKVVRLDDELEEAMQSTATDSIDRRQDLYSKTKDSTLEIFDQTTKLIAADETIAISKTQAAEITSLLVSASAQSSLASKREGNMEELELDDLVDLVDDEDEVEGIPKGYTTANSQSKSQVGYVDLTKPINLKSGNNIPIQMIDLEKKKHNNLNNNAEVVHLDDELEEVMDKDNKKPKTSSNDTEVIEQEFNSNSNASSNKQVSKIECVDVINLKNKDIKTSNVENGSLDTDTQLDDKSDALFMDTDEIGILSETENIQPMDIE